MPLQISEKVMALAAQAQAGLRDQFDRIDSIAEENTRKVLAAFQKHRVAEAYFAGTTGYGYDDLGRDKLDEIFAELFGTEDALVRVQFVNGTHAISCALFGALKPGDILVSAVGAPYDTMLGVIGVVDKGPGSLKSYGIEYRQVDLLDDAPDPEGLARAGAGPRAQGGADPTLQGLLHPFVPLRGGDRGAVPGGAGQQPGGRHSGGQLLRRICGDIGAHPGRGRPGGGFPDQKPPAADWLPPAAILPDGGIWWRGPPCG